MNYLKSDKINSMIFLRNLYITAQICQIIDYWFINLLEPCYLLFVHLLEKP